jgi:hypothetical protein
MTSEPVTIDVTPSAKDYLGLLVQYGLLDGEQGQQDIKDSALQVLEALHHVLGGGTVSIEIVDAGDPAVVGGLNDKLADAKAEWNQLGIDFLFF